MQGCSYDPFSQTEISCFNMDSGEQLIDGITDTLSPYGNIEELIEALELRDCDMLNLTINDLRFLPQLQGIISTNSTIKTLSSEEFRETSTSNGMYC